jgi:hypothetical protein
MKHWKFKDYTGKRFGRLVVLNQSEYQISLQGRKSVMWNCVCDCGTNKVIRADDLRSNRTTSCGCYQKEVRTTHGCSQKSGVGYESWRAMKKRCLNESDSNFKNYGGRGINVCDRWKNSFEHFISDMGFPPSKRHSIERVQNSGNYEPENCRWALIQEQARNKRNNHNLTINGVTKCIFDWAKESPVDHTNIYRRLMRGFTPEMAVFHESLNLP